MVLILKDADKHGDADSLYNLAIAYEDVSKFSQAAVVWKKLNALDPHDSEVKELLQQCQANELATAPDDLARIRAQIDEIQKEVVEGMYDRAALLKDLQQSISQHLAAGVSQLDPLGYAQPVNLQDVLSPTASDVHLFNRMPRQTLFPLSYYRGYAPQHEWSCEEISHIPTEEEFMAKYVIPRKPVKIRRQSESETSRPFERLGWGVHRWDDEYLTRHSGDVVVTVEASRNKKAGDSGKVLHFGRK